MFRPSDKSTNRIARFVMRTHAVPAWINTKGRHRSAAAIIAMPIQRAWGCFFIVSTMLMGASALGNADPRRFAADSRRSKSHDQAPHFETSLPEVEEQANAKFCCPQVVDALQTVGASEEVDGLYFHDYLVFHDEVRNVVPHDDPLVLHGDRPLVL